MSQQDLVLNSVSVYVWCVVVCVYVCIYVLFCFSLFLIICIYSAESSKGSRKQRGEGRPQSGP